MARTGKLLAASALHVMWGDGELDLGRTTAEKRVHRMAYAGDVMKFDRPWEGDGCGYFHVVEDADAKGKLYRLYYMASSEDGRAQLGRSETGAGQQAYDSKMRSG